MSWDTKPPSADAQLRFLTKLQRIFAEGDFTATYKFALLIALADLAVEVGADNDDALILTNRQIGLRFITLYWKHAVPYASGRANTKAQILIQNKGAQAAVVSAIAAFRDRTRTTTINTAASHTDFNNLLTAVAVTVSSQPLTYLQNFGGGTDEFIFERIGGGKIRLQPGVGYCLRRFYPLIQQLARSHWLDHIKGNRRNLPMLGEADDLEDFLFSSSRQSLQVMQIGLLKLDGSKCFYCGHGLTSTDVDHYIPFSLYPRDLAHNFVLAHPACNRSKSDSLAALAHLERWLERLHLKADALKEIGSDAGFVTDIAVAQQVGAWAYSNAISSESKAWVKANDYVAIDNRYAACFGISS